MIRAIFAITAATCLLLGCADRSEAQAKKLFELAEKYADSREYDKTIEILQKIRIDYEATSYAEKAENHIKEYKDLQDLHLVNQQRTLQNTFSQIGRALENYKARFLVYPLTSRELEEKLPAVVVPEWDDVWGNPVYYTPVYSNSDLPKHSPDGYALASFGMDGLPGGVGENKDHFYKNGKEVATVTD